MLWRLILFELRYHSLQIAFRAAVLAFFGIGLAMSQANLGGLDIRLDSPYALTYLIGLATLATGIVIALLTGGAVLRDEEHGMASIVQASHLSRYQWMASRFAGLFGAATLVLVALALGLYLGRFLPWTDPSRFGVATLRAYLWPVLFVGLPNILLGAAIIFSTAALTRNAMATHISGVFLYILYFVGSILGNSPLMASSSSMAPADASRAALLEPYGLVAFLEQTRYWSIAAKNADFPALAGALLHNRLLWVALSLLLLVITYRLTSFRVSRRPQGRASSELATADAEEAAAKPADYKPVAPNPEGWSRRWRAYLALSWLNLANVVRGFPFYALILLWTFFVAVTMNDRLRSGELGVPYVAETGILLGGVIDSLLKLGVLVVVFFAAELVWLERSRGIAPLTDSTPTGNTETWAAKVTALASVVMILIALTSVTGGVIQWFHGSTNLRCGLYLSLFPRLGIPLVVVGVLAILWQTLVPSKYGGLAISFLFLALFGGVLSSRSLGIEHPLLRFGFTPEFVYSDMAASGYHDDALPWYLGYWSALALGIGVLTICLWRRGVGFEIRRPEPGLRGVAAVGILGIVVCGGVVFSHTNLQAPYLTREAKLDRAEAYERRFKTLEEFPMPTVTRVTARVDIDSDHRSYRVEGKLTFENHSDEAMDRIPVGISDLVGARNLAIEGAEVVERAPEHDLLWFQLQEPLRGGGDEGSNRVLEFEFEVNRDGYRPPDAENYVLNAAAYIELDKVLPYFGYDPAREIQGRVERRKRGLPTLESTMVSSAPTEPSVPVEADITVSVAEPREIVAPGERIESWSEGGRRFARYTLQQSDFSFGVAAAAYETQTRQAGAQTITLAYHPEHRHNLERILDSAADSLDYYQTHFSAFPGKTLAIAELPRFSDRFGGTAYPGAIFGVENRLFLLNQSEDTLDAAYRLIAHEVAHQWWGEQLTPAIAPGYRFLTEFLAVYSEMMVYQREYGPSGAREYLDLTRDLYFYMRSYEEGVESPLASVGEQPYVYYFKGANVAYVLRELIGEQEINAVLAQFLADYPFPQRPRARDLARRLLDVAPEAARSTVDELLNRVVTYDLRPTSATSVQHGATSELRIEIEASKSEQDPEGAVTTGPIQCPIEVGILVDEDLVQVQRVHLDHERQEISLITSHPVDAIVLDPRGLMFEADRDDNRRSLKAL